MALTFRRWLVIATLACATLAVWQLPAADGGDSVAARAAWAKSRLSRGYVHGYWDLDDRLRQLNDRLRVLELRDSLLPNIGRARGKNDGLTVLLDRQLPDSLGAMIERALHDRAKAYGLESKASVVVAIVVDIARMAHGLPDPSNGTISASVFLPDSSTSGACLTVARVRDDVRNLSARTRRILTEGVSSRTMAQSLLGPCALYSTFGTPGPNIGHWLRSTGWQWAQVIDWNTAADPWHEPRYADYATVHWYYGSLRDVLTIGDTLWATRNRLSDDAVECIGGDRPHCGTVLVEAKPPEADTVWSAHVTSVNAYNNSAWWRPFRQSGFGPQGGWLVSDMIQTLGRERFTTFWTSALPPDSAYRAATGEDLSTWVERWATRIYGTDVLGPRVRSSAAIAGLLAVLLGLTVAIGFAKDRRVA